MPIQPSAKSPSASPPKPRPHLAPGTTIAERYRVLDVLGEGSMGTVYVVEHLLLKKKMAVKILHPELMAVKSLAVRFEREAMATAKIEHPNVAAALDFGRLGDGSMYLALEFVEGTSLRQEVAKGAFPIARALHIARQIASLLAAAQPLGIVHRDLKPENVMLVRRGEDPDFVKVLDFGIARVTSPSEGSVESAEVLTKLGAVFGTPEYMAPEQALGQRVDTRADLYSLGVMLFEMIAGVRPYSTTGGQSGILAQQITAPRPNFSDVVPNLQVPEAVERVVNRLLAKGVAERYQRAGDVVQLLEGLLASSEGFAPSTGLAPAASEALPAFELNTQIPDPTDTGGAEAPATAAGKPGGTRLDLLLLRSLPRAWASVQGQASRLRDRMVRVLGPKFAGIPPLAVLAFGVGLSLGLVLAIVVWIAAATRQDPAQAATNASANGSLAATEASALAPAGIGSGALIAPTASADSSRDPDTILSAIQGKLAEGRDSDAIALLVKVLSKHPDRRSDPRVAEGLYRLANSTTKETSDTAFALLEGTMATKGADIVYQLSLDKAVREATRRRADKWLRSEQFERAASNATQLAVRLRTAETCERKRDLLPLAAKGGAAFVLSYLRDLEAKKGCGIDGNSDCFPCLRKDDRLKDALAQIESRMTR